MAFVPDAGQLSQVMSQSTAPAFVLGAVAGFVSIMLGRMTSVLDRIRSLNEISDDDTARAHLKPDIPRLRQRAKLLNSATYLALTSGMCTALLLVVGFGAAYLGIRHEYGAACCSLSRFACWARRSSSSHRKCGWASARLITTGNPSPAAEAL